MEFFIKQIFIPSSHTLPKVSNYIVCKIAMPPSIFWKREIDTNVIKECELNSEMFLGYFSFPFMWMLAVSACLSEALHPQWSSLNSMEFITDFVPCLWQEDKKWSDVWCDDKTEKWFSQREV